MSGSSGIKVTFVGNAMAAVVQGVHEVDSIIGQRPVVVGGLAVLARLSNPYRATVDLDVVDRLLGDRPQLEVLRDSAGTESVAPAAVLLPTQYGTVKVDVLEVRQIELERPSDDPGDRLHASSHAWAYDTATAVTIEVLRSDGERIAVTTPIAEPGPLIAMKLQAVANRSTEKQGTDLLDVVRLTLDHVTRPILLAQISDVTPSIATDIASHIDLWFGRHSVQSLRWIRGSGGEDVTEDDLDLVAELLTSSCLRTT